MTSQQNAYIKDLTRGGQTTLHAIRMLLQILERVYVLFVLLFLSYSGLWVYLSFSCYRTHYVVLQSWISANYRLWLGHISDRMLFKNSNGHWHSVSPLEIVNNNAVNQLLFSLKQHVFSGLFYGLMLALSSCLLLMLALRYLGKHQRQDRYLRGAYLSDNARLIKLLQQKQQVSALQLAGVPLIKDAEKSHFLITGSPGTGKTVCMTELLAFIRKQNQRAIVYDKTGDFVKEFYRPDKDILLNPLDTRCPPWDVWAESRDASDYDTLAAALMPLPLSSQDPFWVNGARTIFSSAARRMQPMADRSTLKLLQYLLTTDLECLASFLQGTEAESLVSERIAKTALSIKTVLANHLKCLVYLKDSPNPFSIRRWVQEDKSDSWLFVTSRADKHESLKPLISVWLDIAGNALLSLPPDRNRRIWMSLDELPSLHRLPYLAAMLAESRKFGGCLIAAIQSIAQLKDIYGENAAEAMSGLCNTRIFFRTPETKTAEWVSKSIGAYEVDEPKEGFSYGANTLRDGVSIQRQRVTRPLVMSTEIMDLPDLQAYLRLPGDWPVTKLQFSYQQREAFEPGFIERDVPLEPLRQRYMVKDKGEAKENADISSNHTAVLNSTNDSNTEQNKENNQNAAYSGETAPSILPEPSPESSPKSPSQPTRVTKTPAKADKHILHNLRVEDFL